MRQKCLVYSSGFVDVVEYPAVIISGSILAKTIYVYIGDLERGLLSGVIPVTRPLIPGSLGVVRVIEVLSEKTEYTGKYYTVTPLGARGLLGVDTNGLLSNYASLDETYLEEEVVSPTPLDALKPILRHAVLLASKCEEPVLIEGCGLISVTLGALLRDLGVDVQFYCENNARSALVFGFNVTSHISNLSKKWRTIVITSLNSASKYRVMRELEYSNLVVSALSLTELIPVRRECSVRVVVIGKGGFLGELRDLVDRGKKVLRGLSRAIKVVKTSELESIKGLLPPRGLGTIIVLD